MKAKLTLAVLVTLLLSSASPCFALMELEYVSKERAKALGVTVRSKPVGTSIYVWLEFKTTGELKHFSHARLAYAAGERSLSTTLLPDRPTPGSVVVFFTADPATLRDCEVTVAEHIGERTNIGHVFKMKDFIEPEAGAKKAGAAAMPSYITAEQIKAMPSTKATVEHKETYTARLRTSDGKQFTLGSDRGEQDVWHFVGTALKVGQTYELPGTFLAYQQRKFYVTAEELKAMPPVKATLELRGPCFSIFRATDGRQFVIGDPGSKREVRQFLGALKEGQAYEFPGAFLDHQKANQR